MSLMSINRRHVRSCIIFTASENYPRYSSPRILRSSRIIIFYALREFRGLSKKSDHAKIEFRERMLDVSAPRRWRERVRSQMRKKSFHLRNRASCSCIGETAPQECETSVFQIPLIERPRRERGPYPRTFHLQIKTPSARLETKG